MWTRCCGRWTRCQTTPAIFVWNWTSSCASRKKTASWNWCRQRPVRCARLDEYALGVPADLTSRIGESIKGLRSLASMQDAINTTLAALKSEADADALRIQTNRAVMQEYRQHDHLFPDAVALCRSKHPEDLKNLAAARVAAHEQQERERLEAERERIRAEEAARLALENQPLQVKENAATLTYGDAKLKETNLAHIVDHSGNVLEMVEPNSAALIKLGEINAAIAPLAISADGLAQLGFAHVATDKAAKLYRAADFPRIRSALIQHLAGTQLIPLQREAA